MAEQCAMIVGYLVPHRCPNSGLATCARCGRPFCDEHIAISQGGLVCLACQQGVEQPVAVAEVARDYTSAEIAAFSTVGSADADGDTFADLS